jgi:hypothetical protein
VGAGSGGHILDPSAARDGGHKRLRVHHHIPHPGEVDDEPIVAERAPRPVVPAPAHRQRQAVAPRGTHRRLHVFGLPAERDYRRAAAHGAVPHAGALVIKLVARQCHVAGYG